MEPVVPTIGYRPMSGLAVAAAVIGMLSCLAIATPLLWILPLLGIALSIAGLADVARAGAEKAGHAAALIGLALSIGFGAQAVTSAVVSRRITESRVKAVASMWLDALRENRLADAQSMISAHLLPPPAADEPAIGFLPAVMAIRACGDAASRAVWTTGHDEQEGEQWGARVRLSPCADGGAVEVRLQVEPAIVNEPAQRVERWTISKIDLGP